MPHGRKVGFSLSDIVLDHLDGDLATPSLKDTAPNFRPMSVVAKRLDGGRPRHRRLCVRWGAMAAPLKKGTARPQFLAHVYCG